MTAAGLLHKFEELQDVCGGAGQFWLGADISG